MRMDSLGYKFFFQAIKEEPYQLKRYSYLLAIIPIVLICFFFNWNRELLLFLSFGYLSAGVGFWTAFTFKKKKAVSFQKQVCQRLIASNMQDIVLLQNNQNSSLTFVNDAFYKVFGFDEGSISTIRLSDFVDAKSLHLFGEKGSKQLSVPSFAHPNSCVEMRSQDGHKYWMELSSKQVIEEDLLTMYTFRDVTDKIEKSKATDQFAMDLIQRRKRLSALKTKEAEVVSMMNLEQSILKVKHVKY